MNKFLPDAAASRKHDYQRTTALPYKEKEGFNKCSTNDLNDYRKLS